MPEEMKASYVGVLSAVSSGLHPKNNGERMEIFKHDIRFALWECPYMALRRITCGREDGRGEADI